MAKRSRRQMSARQQKRARRDAKAAVRCIWCGSPPGSVEHIIATRFIDVLREDPRGLRLPVGLTWTDPHSRQVRRLVGNALTNGRYTLDFTARVCKLCNNQWMNDVDDAAFAYVAEMIRGHSITLDADAQCAVATWIAKVALTSRFSTIAPAPLNKVWTDGMYHTGTIAPDWHVWIGTYDGSLPLAYQPEDVRVEKAKGEPPFLKPPGPNAKIVHPNGVAASLAIGYLVVQVLGFVGEFDLLGVPPETLIEIWPTTGPVEWPPPVAITDDALAASFGRFTGVASPDIARALAAPPPTP